MLNDQIKIYKEEYGKLVDLIVHIHNKNIHFLHWPDSEVACREINSTLRKIQKLSVSLRKNTKLIYVEGRKLAQEEKIRIRKSRKVTR